MWSPRYGGCDHWHLVMFDHRDRVMLSMFVNTKVSVMYTQRLLDLLKTYKYYIASNKRLQWRLTCLEHCWWQSVATNTYRLHGTERTGHLPSFYIQNEGPAGGRRLLNSLHKQACRVTPWGIACTAGGIRIEEQKKRNERNSKSETNGLHLSTHHARVALQCRVRRSGIYISKNETFEVKGGGWEIPQKIKNCASEWSCDCRR